MARNPVSGHIDTSRYLLPNNSNRKTFFCRWFMSKKVITSSFQKHSITNNSWPRRPSSQAISLPAVMILIQNIQSIFFFFFCFSNNNNNNNNNIRVTKALLATTSTPHQLIIGLLGHPTIFLCVCNWQTFQKSPESVP